MKKTELPFLSCNDAGEKTTGSRHHNRICYLAGKGKSPATNPHHKGTVIITEDVNFRTGKNPHGSQMTDELSVGIHARHGTRIAGCHLRKRTLSFEAAPATLPVSLAASFPAPLPCKSKHIYPAFPKGLNTTTSRKLGVTNFFRPVKRKCSRKIQCQAFSARIFLSPEGADLKNNDRQTIGQQGVENNGKECPFPAGFPGHGDNGDKTRCVQ